MRAFFQPVFVLFWCLSGQMAAADPVALSKVLDKTPSTFGVLTCQQLRSYERKIRKAGGICLSVSGKAQVVEGIRVSCISQEERVLPLSARQRLEELRRVAEAKGCS